MSEDAVASEALAADVLEGSGPALDPLGDAEEGNARNRAKVGSARPSSLLYTYGPGSIMDLPGFSVMPAGLDDWDRIWKRRDTIPTIVEPRLLDVVRLHLGPQVDSLRPYPWQPKQGANVKEGSDLGVPARVFPQWLRCTGCDYLGPISRFHYSNTHPFRPDLAQFVHRNCAGRARKGDGQGVAGQRRGRRESPAVPAQHLLTCTNGHLDEFPYNLWVHRGKQCSKAESPDLKMWDSNLGKGVGSTIQCSSCGERRGMAEAQGTIGREKLPHKCRGRHPHLEIYETGCDARPALIMMGASNLWFASTQSIIVMPRTEAEEKGALADNLRSALGLDLISEYAGDRKRLTQFARVAGIDLTDLSEVDYAALISAILNPPEEGERQERLAAWDPVELLVPEWNYLQRPSLFPKQENDTGLMVTEMPVADQLKPLVQRVVAIDKMKRVNAFIGFTRLDEMNRVGDVVSRLVKLTRNGRPTWVPATEDRGEGIFIQLDLDRVADWEDRVRGSLEWGAHTEAHRRNFQRRFSETAKWVDPDTRLPAPRYWLLHTLSHVLIREMAMKSGYGAASLTERIYAWPAVPGRDAAAGLFIGTTASDSEGTLGGLVALAEPARLGQLVMSALRRASRCSSDPVCAMRVPADPEDFLHGAACHCCTFASETSCEAANRFLDRRLLLDLPSASGNLSLGFFGDVRGR